MVNSRYWHSVKQVKQKSWAHWPKKSVTRGDWWYYQTNWIGKNIECHLKQWSPTFLAPGTSCVEDNFSTDGGGGRFHDDSSTLHLPITLFLLLLHWLHLISSGIKSWRLGTPDVKVWTKELQDLQRIYFLPSAKGDLGTPLSPSLREQEGIHNTPMGHLQRLPTSKRNWSHPPPVLRISGGGGWSQQKRVHRSHQTCSPCTRPRALHRVTTDHRWNRPWKISFQPLI